MNLGDIRDTFELLTARERRQWLIVTAMGVFSAMLEFLGLSAAIPVVTLLVDFETTIGKEGYSYFYQLLGAPEKNHFLIIAAVAAIIINVLSTLIVLLYQFAQGRFFRRLNAELATRTFMLYEGSSLESIEVFTQAEYLRNINAASERLANMYAGISAIVARTALLLVVLVVLLAVNPEVTSILILAMVGCYVVIYAFVKPFIKLSFGRNFSDQKEFQRLVIGSYKAKRQVLVYSLSSLLVSEFRALKKRIARRTANIEIVGSTPRYLVETVGVVCLLASALFIGINNGDKTVIVGNLSVFVICAYRALPAIQQIYNNSNLLSGSLVIYRDLLYGWKKLRPAFLDGIDRKHVFECASLSLERVSYVYPGASEAVIKNYSCSLPLSGMIRIAGDSGAGKTTLIELILGLRMPSSGHIAVGAMSITPETVSAWLRCVSYVPQSFYLFANSVPEAVCGGGDYDEARFKEALWVSGLDQVLAEKGLSHHGRIGLDGAGLSGGERARIALACAFYKDAKLMVFDEAFANLDLSASRAVLDRVSQVYPDRACIFVTHRGAELPESCIEIRLDEEARHE